MAEELRIPPPYRAPFVELAAWSEGTFGPIAAALEAADPYPSLSTLVTLLRTGSELTKDDAIMLIGALSSALTQDSIDDADADALASGIANSPDLRGELDRPALAARLARIFKSAALQTTSKALDLGVERERLFRDSRVMTDVRPMFLEAATELPTGGIITHTLNISYSENGRGERFFVALDDDDLTHLGEVIARALEKSQSIRSLFAAKEVPIVDLSETEGEQ